MNLADGLDEAALNLRRQGDPYEVAVMLASQAARLAEDSNSGGSAALIRDIFGTYAQRIHSFDGRDGLPEAEQANREITEALADWEAGDRTDVAGFASRWINRVGGVDTTWLAEVGQPLRKMGALGVVARRLRRRSRR